MNIYKIYTFFIALVLSANVFAQAEIMTTQDRDYYEGVIRVRFTEDMAQNFQNIQLKSATAGSNDVYETGVNQVDNLNSSMNVFSFKRVFPYSEKFEARHRKHNLHLWYEINYDKETNIHTMLANYSQVSGIDLVKPVYCKVAAKYSKKVLSQNKIKAANLAMKSASANEMPFDDPELYLQWHYENYGDIVGTEDADIDLFSAWQKETGTDSVIVAIIDEGVDYLHEDLADAMWVNEAELNGEEGVDDDGNGYIDDIYGYNFYTGLSTILPGSHGTHVAGTVAAINNNGVGVGGIAGGDGETPGVKIMGCQIYSSDGGSGGTELAYIYAADNGAVIAQSSWGYTSAGDYEPEVLAAIDYFYEEAGQFDGSLMIGGAHFFSSGNASTDGMFYPGSYEKVIGVTSTGPTNYPASYTNYNEVYDIAAPGGDAIDNTNFGGVYSTFPNNQYGYLSGTSMATPHVSGVAALIVSQFGGGTFTNEDLYSKVLDYATPFGTELSGTVYDGKMGVGRLNALSSLLENLNKRPDKVEYFTTPETTHDRVELEWIVPADEDDIVPTGFQFALSQLDFEASEFSEQEVFSLEGAYDVGDTVTATLSGLFANTQYYIAIKAVDTWGNTSESSEIVPFKTLDYPNFQMSEHAFEIKIDVSETTTANEKVTFKNTGPGRVDWTSDVANYDFLWPDYIDSTVWYEDELETETAALKSTLVAKNSNVINKSIEGIPFNTDSYDRTVYVAGLMNDPDTDPEAYYGVTEVNHRLVHATRFVVPTEYYFNFTHVDAWLYITNDTDPIQIDIRKGKDLQTSEIVYQRFYTPDTVGVQQCNIPLARPIYMDEAEYFWIVMSHPKDEHSPIITNYYSSNYGVSFCSFDGGVSWTDFQDITAANPQTIKVRAYSVGSDPTYAYLDPYEGEVVSEIDEEVNVYVNAENLRNGEHNAFINIYTNDPNHTYASIDVALLVTGQKGNLQYETSMSFADVIVNQSNELEISLGNNGLGKIDITDVKFDNGTWSNNIDSALVIYPDYSETLTLYHTPTELGMTSYRGEFITSEGEFSFILNITTREAVEYNVDTTNLQFFVNKGEVEYVNFTLENIHKTQILEYDVLSESAPEGERAISPITDYEVEIINDASLWRDISETGSYYQYYEKLNIPLTFNFPFYESQYENVSINLQGMLIFGSTLTDVFEIEDYPCADGFRASISVLTKLFSGGTFTEPRSMYYQGFGKSFVYQLNDVRELGSDGHGADFQAELFDNGTIEFRYNKMDSLNYNDARIGMQNLNADIAELVKSVSDSTFVINDGDVIRFTPKSSTAFLSYIDNDNGEILPGESVDFTVELDESINNLNEGTYRNIVTIQTNGAQETIEIPVDLTVTGAMDSITVDTTNIAFGQVYSGIEYIDTIYMHNWGTTAVEFESYSTQLRTVTLEGVDDAIEAGEIRTIIIRYNPTSFGEKSEVLRIVTEAEVVELTLSATASESPSYALSDDGFSFDLTTVNSDGDEFSISNQSSRTPLQYQLYAEGPIVFESKDDQESNIQYHPSGQLDSCYSYITDSMAGVDYFFEDIRVSGEELTFTDDGFIQIDLPFEYQFFNESYSSIWINENGYATVEKPTVSSDPFTYEFLEDDAISGMIVPLYGEWSLSSSPNTGIFHKIEEDRLIVHWNDVASTDSYSPGEVTFELIIFNDGRIRFIYKSINEYLGYFNMGLEDLSEQRVLDLGYPGIDLDFYGIYPDSTALQLTPALSGTLEPGESETFPFVVTKEYLNTGDYLNQITIVSNDSDQPVRTIDVQTKVQNTALIEHTDSIDFGTSYASSVQVSSAMYISNRGGEPVDISYITSEGISDFDILVNNVSIPRYSTGQLKSRLLIEGGSTLSLTVLSGREELGNFNGVITFKTRDGNTIEVVTKNEVVDVPSVNTSSNDTVIYMNQNEIKTFDFNVSNVGNNNLDYQMLGIYQGLPKEDLDMMQPPTITIDSMVFGSSYETDLFYGSEFDFMTTNIFEIGDDGFDLTHVKAFLQVNNTISYNLRLIITEYPLDDYPYSLGADSIGEVIYEEYYSVFEDYGSKWRYMYIPGGMHLEANKKYGVTIGFTVSESDQNILGIETSYEQDPTERCYYVSGNVLNAGYNSHYDNAHFVWKIRIVSGASQDGFLSFDPEEGALLPNEEQKITVSIDGNKLQPGENLAKIMANGANYSTSVQRNLTVIADGVPEFVYTPSTDTLSVQEFTPYTGNYWARDPEGLDVTLDLLSTDGLEATLEDGTENGLAKLKFNTDYNGEGIYNICVKATDPQGNSTVDTLVVNIFDKNRPPYLIYDEPIVINIANDDAFQTSMYNIFTDPDGDDLDFYIGNYNPEVMTTTLVDDQLMITSVEEGVGVVLFLADDGKEDGYVGYGYYVYVINDPSYENDPNGIGNNPFESIPYSQIGTYPNPIENESNIVFALEEEADIRIELIDMMGHKMETISNQPFQAGNHTVRVSLSTLRTGNYFYQLYIDGRLVDTIKLLKK